MERNYYADIPIGAENAISRKALARLWNASDRAVRDIIAQLRAEDNGDGYIIVSYSSGKGYYKTNDPNAIRHYVAEVTNRARNTFKPLKKARRVLRELARRTADETSV